MQLSDLDSSTNLVQLFLERADEGGDKPFLGAKRGGAWQTISWREAAQQVCLLAESLRRIGLNAGDRVMLVSENRPEWCIADLAIMAAGCVTVPTYTTNTERDHAHILDNSGARAVIVSTEKLSATLLPAVMRTGTASHVITIDGLRQIQAGDLGIHHWADMISGDAAAARTAVDARIAGIGRQDLACLIYTSGTGGAPKGVMLPHRAMLSNCAGAHALFGRVLEEGETYLSFLPLSHSFERTCGQFFLLSVGTVIHYSRGVEHLGTELGEVRPSVLTLVPRLLEVMRARILAGLPKQPGWKQALFRATLAAGLRREAGTATLLDRLAEPLLDRLVRAKVMERFGGRLKGVVSGGARLDPEVGKFFRALGLPLMQGYGQTEAGPVVSCSPLERVRIDTVGPTIAGVEVRLAEDGEILVRGDLLMQGYWNQPAATEAAIRDGWLHTGDIGAMDADGYLRITDRKKDILVLSGGDNVSPARIEGALLGDPTIAQAAVFGDARPYLVAVLVPSEAARTAHPTHDDLAHAVAASVDAANRKLSVTERIRRFHIAEAGFTIDNGMLTPTQKVRRHKVREAHTAAIEALYG